jgi:hypothetical protein
MKANRLAMRIPIRRQHTMRPLLVLASSPRSRRDIRSLMTVARDQSAVAAGIAVADMGETNSMGRMCTQMAMANTKLMASVA